MIKKEQNYLTNTAKELILKGYGYRNDYYYGTFVRDLDSILDYEIIELYNTDILATVRKLYGLKFDMRNKKKSIEIVKNYLYSRYNSQYLEALWLTTEEMVKMMYGGQDEQFISCYGIPKNALIISDLGLDGALFVSSMEFEKIN